MNLEAGRLHECQPRNSFPLYRYMGGGLCGWYLVIFKRWYIYFDWVR